MLRSKRTKLLLLAFIASVSFISCGKVTVEDVTKDLNNGNYTSAVKDFKNLSEEEKSKLTEEFTKQTTKIKDGFIKGEIDKTKAIESLTEIKLVDGMYKIADETITTINKVDKSKNAFIEAKKAEESKNYVTAIEQYGKVIQDDIGNYDIAQAKVDELSKKIEDSIPVKIMETGLSRDITNRQTLNVQLNNKSDKPTKQINFLVFAYDKNKLPVKLNFGHSDYVSCKLDKPLQPNETSTSDWSWNLYPEGNEIAEVVVVLSEVEFFEGEKWVNPASSASIEKYAGKPLK